eukprot:m.165081 g.165081  ORF g.165081 m.165081 type:complete len:280 (+) comp53109_c0_seq3:181-1020(+)
MDKLLVLRLLAHPVQRRALRARNRSQSPSRSLSNQVFGKLLENASSVPCSFSCARGGRGGLGRDELERQQLVAAALARQRLAEQKTRSLASLEQGFLARQRKLHADRTLMKDLSASQSACRQLDEARGILAHSLWPVPEPQASLHEEVAAEEPKNLATEGLSLHQLHPVLFSPGLHRRFGILQGPKEGDRGADQATFEALEPIVRLEIVTAYLRNAHWYCTWCGTSYESKVPKNCLSALRYVCKAESAPEFRKRWPTSVLETPPTNTRRTAVLSWLFLG